MAATEDAASADVLQWRLYPDSPDAATPALAAACLAHALPFCAGYVWQADPFALAAQPGGDEPPCLAGCARTGLAVEDEWLVVWLLLELTRRFPGVTARVWDGDGEFLLIEAAYALPRWASRPAATAHRCFLRAGELRLVPPAPGAKHAPWSLADGLQAVAQDGGGATLAPEATRAAIAAAVAGFPARAMQQVHTARARMPSRAALLLQAQPQLLAPAVAAFAERDPAAMRVASRAAVFPPVAMVTTGVRFSRALYAQLAQQQYTPHRSWPLPLPADAEYHEALLGAKLAAGLEIAAADWARGGVALPPPDAAPVAPAQAVADDTDWVELLERGGFFRGEVAAAAKASIAAAAQHSAAEHAALRAAAAAPDVCAAALLAACPQPAAADFPPPPAASDSDAWLADGETLLDSALAQRAVERGDGAQPSDAAVAAAAAGLSGVAEGVRAFVDGAGDLELDATQFLKHLSSAVGLDWAELRAARGMEADDSASDTLSDDFDEGTAESESDDAPADGVPPMEAPDWRRFRPAAGGPDSDDEEGGAAFGEAYDEALAEQLRGTVMAEDFARGEAAGEGAGEQPVAVDLNLVQSLLASYGAQEGLPGPVSNLLGVLGLALPQTQADKR